MYDYRSDIFERLVFLATSKAAENTGAQGLTAATSEEAEKKKAQGVMMATLEGAEKKKDPEASQVGLHQVF